MTKSHDPGWFTGLIIMYIIRSGSHDIIMCTYIQVNIGQLRRDQNRDSERGEIAFWVAAVHRVVEDSSNKFAG